MDYFYECKFCGEKIKKGHSGNIVACKKCKMEFIEYTFCGCCTYPGYDERKYLAIRPIGDYERALIDLNMEFPGAVI